MNHETRVAGSDDFLPNAAKILVTGASGFIGTHLVARLQSMGKTVICASRSNQLDFTRDDLPFDGVGHVVHAGALTGVVGAWENPSEFINVNTLGTARLLEQCRRHGCGMTFISAYVYGTPERLPILESDRIEPNNPYALSKFLAEQVCSFYTRVHGVNTVALRLFNIYGPGQSEAFLVPFVVRQVLDPSREVIEVRDLAPSRDYLFVSDAVDAILQSTQAEPGSVFNVGSGKAHTVEQIINFACSAAGVHKSYTEMSRPRRNEIDATVADTRKILEAVGWRPTVSIESGLRQTVESMRIPCQS
jgi:nucleoside-diphosphate-sugar epimerase